MNWHAQRTAAEQVPCPAKPYGCGAPAGDPCTNLQTGAPLGQRPAHERRLLRAEAHVWPPEDDAA